MDPQNGISTRNWLGAPGRFLFSPGDTVSTILPTSNIVRFERTCLEACFNLRKRTFLAWTQAAVLGSSLDELSA